jgi:hypothetical protein
LPDPALVFGPESAQKGSPASNTCVAVPLAEENIDHVDVPTEIVAAQ